MKYKHEEIDIPDGDPFANCKLDRKASADVLTQIVQHYAAGFVLTIDGKWGTGKTTFVRMWKSDLIKQGFRCLYFNAWENDFISDPMVGLLGELRNIVTTKREQTFNSVVETGAQFALKMIPALTKGLVSHYCGENVADIMETATTAGTEIFKTEVIDYDKKKNELVRFKELLARFILEESNGKPLIFIVDELDRCSPHYAVQVLEKIKHFFSIKGIVFILSIDKQQLCSSIKGYYGSDTINAEEYLKRFIDIEYILPEPDIKLYCNYLYDYFEFNLFYENEDRKHLSEFQNDKEQFLTFAYELVKAKKLTLRQIEKLFSHARLVLASCRSNNYIFPNVTCLLIYLRSYEPDIYKGVRNCTLSYQELADVIIKVLPPIMFNEDPYTTKPGLVATVLLFFLYEKELNNLSHSKLLVTKDPDVEDGNKLTFDIEYIDNNRFIEFTEYFNKIYHSVSIKPIYKSIDLLRSIID